MACPCAVRTAIQPLILSAIARDIFAAITLTVLTNFLCFQKRISMIRYVIPISEGKCRLGRLVLLPSRKGNVDIYAMSRADGRQMIAGTAPSSAPLVRDHTLESPIFNPSES